jgi:UDP-N-acetylglucosamine diphosphorylase/glucosamine-1-phosphate N-acetyltransferase
VSGFAALIVFEDSRSADLAPLADLLPVPALAFGGSHLAARWALAADVPLAGIEARAAAMACWRDAPPPAPPADDGRVLAVNAACLPARSILDRAEGRALFTSGGRMVAAIAPARELAAGRGSGAGFEAFLGGLGLPVVEIDARIIDRPWRMIEWNAEALASDLAGGPFHVHGEVHPRAVLEAPERVSIARGARVDALALIDAREGPVRIGPGATIAPHSWVRGPCHVGAGTQILGGLVGRSTIGPDCRLAGEIEDCIWQGRANKRHHGFVGHSVVGEWVNLGALTTTSDLKNNYGEVRIQMPGGEVNTGSRKIGALIGAHVKTGIGTLLPTGAWAGTGANLFGGGRFAPKHVAPFAWWDGEHMREHRLEAFLATAGIAASRRGARLEPAEQTALREWFTATAPLRQSFDR